MAVRTGKACSSNSCLAAQQGMTVTFWPKTPNLMSSSVCFTLPTNLSASLMSPSLPPPLSFSCALSLSYSLCFSFPFFLSLLCNQHYWWPTCLHCLLPPKTLGLFQCAPSFTRKMLWEEQPGPAPVGEWLLPKFGSEMGMWPILAKETWGVSAEGFLMVKRWLLFGLGFNCVWIWCLDPLQSDNKDRTKDGREKKKRP